MRAEKSADQDYDGSKMICQKYGHCLESNVGTNQEFCAGDTIRFALLSDHQNSVKQSFSTRVILPFG